jgi:hypothetical protein
VSKPIGIGGGATFLRQLFAQAFRAQAGGEVKAGKHSAKGARQPAGNKLRRKVARGLRSHMWS